MPSATGVVQEAGVPRRPSISTRHSRQEPKASTLSVAHSLGMRSPTSAAARITEVPSGTVTSKPSTVSVTCASDRASGVPMSQSFGGMTKSFMSDLRSGGAGCGGSAPSRKHVGLDGKRMPCGMAGGAMTQSSGAGHSAASRVRPKSSG